MLERVDGPVLDIGCGPARHALKLAEAGIVTLGIDISLPALTVARRRGAPVLHRSIFERVPGHGRWGTALLLDGNIGIGGVPDALLRRVATLLRVNGRVLVEVGPPGTPTARDTVRLEHDGTAGPWFAWANVGIDDVDDLARASDLHVDDIWTDSGRWFASAGRMKSPRSKSLQQDLFTSKLHDERNAALLGSALGITFTICFVTGLYSHFAQHPPSWFLLPSRPAGLYRVTQGLHIATGLASIPLLLAKLWTVYPKLFTWPPFSSIANALERLAIFPLVAGSIFLLFTGLANINLWYPWQFNFPIAHYWAAWTTIGALIVHIGAKWSITRRQLLPSRTQPRRVGRNARRPLPKRTRSNAAASSPPSSAPAPSSHSSPSDKPCGRCASSRSSHPADRTPARRASP